MAVLYLFLISILLFLQKCTTENNKSSAVPQIIVDTDPGVDDAVAMLLLLTNPDKVTIKAITVVNGNTNVVNGSSNAIRTLEVAKRLDIPVYRGAGRALVYNYECMNYFGPDGFGEAHFQSPLPQGVLRHEVAANALVDYVKSNPNQLTILALGPLTNIAIAISLYPEFLDNIKEMIILGGAYQGVGNVQPGSEFNFNCDPESAQLVLNSAPENKPIVLLPIETVQDISFSLDWRIKIFGSHNTPYIKFLNKIEAYSVKKKNVWRTYDGTAASILLDPKLVAETKMVSAQVLTSPEAARGVLLINYYSKKPNIRLVTKLNKPILKDILTNFSKKP